MEIYFSLMLLVLRESFTAGLLYVQFPPGQNLINGAALSQTGLLEDGNGKIRNGPLKPLFRSGVCHFCSHFIGQDIHHQAKFKVKLMRKYYLFVFVGTKVTRPSLL